MDKVRYAGYGKMPAVQRYYRKVQSSSGVIRFFYKVLFYLAKHYCHIELPDRVKIGGGLYMGHHYMITVNEDTIIGKNCNIHKGVTIGAEYRGSREGAPKIGDNVWIGIGSVIVGKINIGDDVLIAPNSFVNRDVPSHSVVMGNPCVIKHRDNATEGYINRTV